MCECVYNYVDFNFRTYMLYCHTRAPSGLDSHDGPTTQSQRVNQSLGHMMIQLNVTQSDSD